MRKSGRIEATQERISICLAVDRRLLKELSSQCSFLRTFTRPNLVEWATSLHRFSSNIHFSKDGACSTSESQTLGSLQWKQLVRLFIGLEKQVAFISVLQVWENHLRQASLTEPTNAPFRFLEACTSICLQE